MTKPPIKSLHIPLLGSFLTRDSFEKIVRYSPFLVQPGGPYYTKPLFGGRIYFARLKAAGYRKGGGK